MSQRMRMLTNEYKALTESIGKDMDLICSTATSCKELLIDSPELIDDAYKKSSTESLRTLNKVRAELEYELTALNNVGADSETGEIAKNLENIFKRPPQPDTASDKFPELNRLERIFKAKTGRAPSSLSPSKKKRKSADQSQSEADLEVVEETEQGVRMDPLTLCPIKVLVQNKRCKHYYCYETIIGHIKTGPYPRCPIAGCSLPHIREDDLEFVD